MSKKLHIGDAFDWLDKVYASCETNHQLKSFINLVNNFKQMYSYEINTYNAYADRFNKIRKDSYTLRKDDLS
jgi:hypothetical protein